MPFCAFTMHAQVLQRPVQGVRSDPWGSRSTHLRATMRGLGTSPAYLTPTPFYSTHFFLFVYRKQGHIENIRSTCLIQVHAYFGSINKY